MRPFGEELFNQYAGLPTAKPAGFGVRKPRLPVLTKPAVIGGGKGGIEPPVFSPRLPPVFPMKPGGINPGDTPPIFMQGDPATPDITPHATPPILMPNGGGMTKPLPIAPQLPRPIGAGSGGDDTSMMMRPSNPMDYRPMDFRPLEIDGFREDGGPVKKRKRYVVGENGPEIFVPEQDGNIVPNDEIKPKPPTSVISEPTGEIRPKLPKMGPYSEEELQTQIVPPTPPKPMTAQEVEMISGGGSGDMSPVEKPLDQARIADMNSLARPEMPKPVMPVPGTTDEFGNAKPIAPGKDPNKSRRENLRDEINDRTGKQFEEKRGFKNVLKGIGIGFLKAFAESDPRAPISQRLWSALGGAAGLGVASGIDPNIPARMQNQAKLAELYGMYGQQTEMDEQDAKVRKAALETEGTRIKNINDRVGDYLKVAMADNKIDDDESKTLQSLTGLPYSPADWQKRVRTNENGIPFIATEFSDASRIDQTRPINPAEVPKNRTIPGQGTFTVSDEKAFPVAGQVAVGNANRADSASRFETTRADKQEEKVFDDEQSYQKELTARNNRVRSANAKLAAANKLAASANADLAKANAEKTARGAYDTSDIDKRIADIEARKAKAEADAAAAAIEKDEPAPTKLVRAKSPATTSSTGKKQYTVDEIKTRGKQLKLSDTQIQAKIEEARQQGLLKQ